MREPRDGAGGTEVRRLVGLEFDFADELGIHLRTGGDERLEAVRNVRITGGDHAAGGVGGFGGGLVLLDDEDLEASKLELAREGEADDSGSDDDGVVRRHENSFKFRVSSCKCGDGEVHDVDTEDTEKKSVKAVDSG